MKELNIISAQGRNVHVRREYSNIKFFEIVDNKVVADCTKNVLPILEERYYCDEVVIRHNNKWNDHIILKLSSKEAMRLLEKLDFMEEIDQFSLIEP